MGTLSIFRTSTFDRIPAQQIEPSDFTPEPVEMKLHFGVMVLFAQRSESRVESSAIETTESVARQATDLSFSLVLFAADAEIEEG